MNFLKKLVILFALVLSPFFVNAKQIELDFMVFETPNLPAEFWDDAIARTVEEFPQFKINKIVPPNVGSMENSVQSMAPPSPEPTVQAGPPVPAEGLPEGWTMEQWSHYGQQWLDNNR